MKILLSIVFAIFCFTANATTYYVSANGNDGNNGTSPSTPWNTLGKVNSFFSSLKAGDNVLFNRGDVFYGTITVNSNGTASAPITIGAYGTGANPVITGFTSITSWTNKGSNIWESSSTVSGLSTCNMVVVNGVNTAMGRTPNYPNYYNWSSHSNTSITSSNLGGINWTGAELAIFNTTYTNIREIVTSQSGSTANWTTSNTFWQNSPGYFLQQFHIQNDIRTLDTLDEWYYNPSTKKLDIYNASAPAGVKVSSVDNLVAIGNHSYITVRDLTLTGSNGDAISIANSDYIHIINCNINFIGTTAIYGITAASHYGLLIDSNTIYQVNNGGIDLKYWYIGAVITNNDISNVRMLLGMDNTAHTISGGAAGITCQSDNGVVSYNKVDSCGVIGISYLGSNIQIDHNVVTNTCIGNQIRDEGAIYTWNGSNRSIPLQMKIFNNIVLNTGMFSEGIYFDQNSNNGEVYNNTVSNVLRGIFLGDSHEMYVHDNTTFNTGISNGKGGAGAGLFMNNNVGSPKLRNITVKNNKFVAKTSTDRALWVITADSAAMPKPFTSDNNYFAKPIGDNVNNIYTYTQGGSYVNRTLASWQALNGQDANSKQSPKAITDVNDFNFQYNATNSPVTIALPYNYMDITGKAYNGSITLQPYTSAVLIKNGSVLLNKLPVANAGPDQTITLPTSLALLTGSASDTDGTISSYNWSKLSGPSAGTIADNTSASTIANGLVQGVYKFQLLVTDNLGGTDKDTVQITVNPAANVPPLVNAGQDQTITLPANSINLSGGATDPDGTIASYAWAKIAGPSAYNITNTSSATTSVTGLVQGIYKFELKATDNSGASTKDTMQVMVNAAPNVPPVANAGVAQTITLPTNTVTLSGSGSDADGTITGYKWTEISGPSTAAILNSSSAVTNINSLVAGIYQFQLLVTDNNGATGTGVVQVTVNAAANVPPVSNAGTDQTITLPTNTVPLSGSGTDADGSIASYLWTEISGPSTFTIANPSSAITIVTGLAQGVYQFQLLVTDNKGATAIDIVQVVVNASVNVPPVANAGTDQVITLPTNIATLAGSGTDADGTIVNYVWAKISGPSAYNIVNAASPLTDVSGLVKGTYQFQLSVTDNNGAISTDIVQIKVNNATNVPPVSNAGSDQSITLPSSTVTVAGSGTDTDGTIASYFWTEISGPSAYNITNASAATTSITGLVEGFYQFQLIVTDNNGATATDIMQVVVNHAINVPPVANAGIDQIITLPVNTVTLSGNGTDADGSIVSYQWTEISGPSTYNFVNASAAVTAINGLTAGVYQLQLLVTDNSGATSTDVVQVTVNAAANISPVSNAGIDQTITLPTNTITLSGSGSDADGLVASYQWTEISGPSSYTIANASAAITNLGNLTEGVYQFQLSVADNNGAISTDIMQVTVNAAINIPPVSNAGADKVIALPANTITLNGNGSDADGTVTNYSWTQTSGPSAATIVNASSATTIISNLIQGVYQFQLIVTDNSGATSTDAVQVTVNAAANIPPVSHAGADQIITLPTNTITLSGSGSDADGAVVSYLWTKISGPSFYNISDASSANTIITALTQGVYRFELKVTDDNNATGADTIQVTVNAGNIPPVANAGLDQSITLPTSSINLNGSGSDADGTVTSYAWTKISGPSASITNISSAATNVTGLAQGLYDFELKVTDNNGATAADTIHVIVNPAANVPPAANAGIDQNITLPVNNITLSGNGTDADGTIASYAWAMISGPSSYTIANAATAVTGVTGLVEGVYQFQITVTDNSGAIASDLIQVTVNASVNIPPVANAGINQTITLPVNSVTLSGSGNDADGTIASYLWTKISGPAAYTIANTSLPSTGVTGLVQGTYKFRLTVTDNNGATSTDIVQVTVNAAPNVPPVANAGTDQVTTLPTNIVTLSGSGSDADGTIASYAWTKISGPASYTITNASSAATSITGLIEGVYQFQLKVTDNSGANSTDVMQVTVNAAANIPPAANAGADQTITLPINSVTLSGSGSDADGTIAGYAWTKISGPASYTIINSSSAATSITGLIEGVYQFQLKVTDNSGAIATDIMQVTVNAAPNVPPTANAGADKVITLPTNIVTLSGSGSDADGTIAAYAWTKISGPSSYTISNASLSSASATGLVQGVYKFQLKVTDNKGTSSTDVMQVTVNAAPNLPPAANAGVDQSITLPVNTITLSGSGTDADGTVASYAWTKISGPAGNTIANAASAITNVSGLAEGVYQFQLKVTDNSGATTTDIMQVTVNAAANIPPVLSAGADQGIILPINNVTLSGSGSDADGNITSYIWTKISGPASYTIATPSLPVTNITGLVQGVYQFELKGVDNSGATATDIVEVTVNAAVNIPPVSNAGADKTITLPVNNVSLSGTGTDADGTITGYHWTKISGPSGFTIANVSAAATSITGLTEGVYQFELRVTDNSGAIGTDVIQVTVNPAANIAPSANAGADQTITLPANMVNLSGSGTDADGTIASYIWTKISGPSSYTIANISSPNSAVTSLVEGVYKFELRVSDNKGTITRDTMKVTVNPAPNMPPVATAPADKTIALPVNTVSLSGSASDADGTVASYVWRKISGPSASVIVNASSPVTDVTGLVEGVYRFELKVTDNDGASGMDTMQITVLKANIVPFVNAGPDQTITLPTNSVILTGSGLDADGSITGYSWKKISGPDGSTISNGNDSVTSIDNLTGGTYQFEFTVTDDGGAVGRDTVTIVVAEPRLNPYPKNNSAKVYPNPVYDVTTLEINTTQAVSNVKLVISNLQGRVYTTKQLTPVQGVIKETLNMTNFGKGMYIVSVYFDGKLNQSIKVIKE